MNRNPYRPPEAKVLTEEELLRNRRPAMLWVIAVIFSTLAALNVATYVYFVFFSDLTPANYAETTFVGYVTRFYHAALVLIGVVGLLMLRRWALYVFCILGALQLFGVIRWLANDPISDETVVVVWVPLLITLTLHTVAVLYALRLVRRGVLR